MQLPLLGLGTFSMHGNVLNGVVNSAIDNGYQLFDTAQLYKNEEELWKSICNKVDSKDKVLFQTKIPGKLIQGNRRWLYLNKQSVKHLCIDKYSFMEGKLPDILLLHSTFQGFEKQYSKLIDFQQKYNVPITGICNICVGELKSLYNYLGKYPQIVQMEIHPYHSNRDLVDFCKEKGIVVEARSPFAHGDAMEEWMKNNKLIAIARNYNKTVPQVLLRWITQQQIIAVTRSINHNHIKDNNCIFDFQLSPQEMESIFNMNKNKTYGVKTIINK